MTQTISETRQWIYIVIAAAILTVIAALVINNIIKIIIQAS